MRIKFSNSCTSLLFINLFFSSFMLSKLYFNFFSLLYISVFTQTKAKIFCGDKAKYSLCYGLTQLNGESQYYVQSCPKGQYCPTQGVFVQCSKKVTSSTHGGPCNIQADCLFGLCENGKCVTRQVGEICNKNNDCEESLICGPADICSKMKSLDEVCQDTSECRIGLECVDYFCSKIGSGENGQIIDKETGCISGITLTNKDGKKYCVTLAEAGPCIEDKEDGEYYCYGILDKGDGNPKRDRMKCLRNWNDTYLCPSERTKALALYLEVFIPGLARLKESDYNRLMNRFTLNDPEIADYYIDYFYFEKVMGADQCIKDYFYQLCCSSSMLALTLSFLFIFLFPFYC